MNFLSNFPSTLCNTRSLLHVSRRCYVSYAQQKKIYQKNKPHLNVGTIGHVDHGKTTLSSAITKVLSQSKKARFLNYEDIDRGAEERARGVTINIAHLEYESDQYHFAHTDCPGHIDYIKNMITGTAQMDAAILVIAADDGVMPQTREHLMLAKQIGLREIVVFVNKADLVEKEDLELVEIEARELLTNYGFDGEKGKIVFGSALNVLQGKDDTCVHELLRALDSLNEPVRIEDGPFLMPISKKHRIKGRGSVLVGTIESGTVKKGDQLEIRGFDHIQRTVIADIHVFSKSVPEIGAGEHVGLLCKNLFYEPVERGMWLGTPETIEQTNLIKVEFYMLREAEGGRKQGIRSGYHESVFCTTWNRSGKLILDEEMLMPGEHTTAHLVFLDQVPIRKGSKFTMREQRKNTIGHGVVTDLYQPVTLGTFRTTQFDFEKLMKDAELVNDKKLERR